MHDKLIIWRKISLTNPIQMAQSEMLVGNEFKNYLDNNFNPIFDTGETKAYASVK